MSREKPYLYLDAHHAYQVFVPATQTSSKGTSLGGSQTPGRSLALSIFFVATPGDSTAKINSALAHGKNLLLTPAIYHTNRSIAVKPADTVVLGLGLATI